MAIIPCFECNHRVGKIQIHVRFALDISFSDWYRGHPWKYGVKKSFVRAPDTLLTNGAFTMRRFILGLAVLSLLVGDVGQANAGVILDLEDPAGQSNTPFAVSFLAGTPTVLEFAGYQLPSSLNAHQIDLQVTGGGPNLLGSSWTFTPAPSGSVAFSFNDGSSVPGLEFGGLVEDSFDRFSQTISTTVGQSYTLSFLFTNNGGSLNNAPSELMVSASNAIPTSAAVPEPSSVVILSIAGGCFGVGAIRKRRRPTAATA